MDLKRKIAMLATTVALAALTGHVMQRATGEDHPANTLRAAAPEPAMAPVRQEIASGVPAVPQLPSGPAEISEAAPANLAFDAAPGAAPAAPEPPLLALSMAPDTPPDALPELFPAMPRMALARVNGAYAGQDEAIVLAEAPAQADDSCTPELVLAVAPGAMIDLAFDAPCHPGARVLLRHEGLAFTVHTSETGALDLSVPAMAQEASVTLAIRGGPSAEAEIRVPELAGFERVAVQWQGEDSFQLHAYEFGARFGEEGHVSARAPGAIEDALEGAGGFLLRLGDGRGDWPLLAEVYSFPVEQAGREGVVRFDVEAAVTQRTCGRDMLGEALHMRPGAPTEVIEITLAMPECDTPDGFLVLNNLLPDMRIAQN